MDLIFGIAAGLWIGDYLGRAYPTQWSAVRLFFKTAARQAAARAKG